MLWVKELASCWLCSSVEFVERDICILTGAEGSIGLLGVLSRMLTLETGPAADPVLELLQMLSDAWTRMTATRRTWRRWRGSRIR